MNTKEEDLFDAYEEEIETLFNIAQKLDYLNPECPGAFTGNPSVRIFNQLVAHGILEKPKEKNC